MRPFLAKKLAAAIQAATEPLAQGLDLVQAQVGVASDELPINTRLYNLRTDITGQATLIGPGMQNRTSALRLNVLEPETARQKVELDTLRDVVLQGFADVGTMFSLLNSQRQLDLAAGQVERTRNDLQDAKDALQDAALAQLAAQDRLTLATDAVQTADIEHNRLDTLALATRQAATDKRQAADELDIAALKASDASQAAQLVAQASGIEADRLLAVAAQAKADQAATDAQAAKTLAQAAQARADQAEADAQAAKTAAAAAQTTANTATTGLATANARVDAVVANVSTVQALATTAQATATTAQAAVTALGDKGRVLLGVATPASAGLLGIGGTMSIALSWPKPFADTSYAGSFLRTSGGTAAMGASLTNKTTTSCTLVLTLTGTVSLAVPAGTGDVVLTHS